MGKSFLSLVHIKDTVNYNGSQLRPHWIYENYKTMGDVCVSFIGSCDIPYKYMVDLEDELAKDSIFSKKMLHIIVELFAKNIYFGVLFQGIIISEIQNELLDAKITVKKFGDDLFLDDKKLSISIATVSMVSTLIHVGINISSVGTPVKTVSLEDLNIDAETFRVKILDRIDNEYSRIIGAVSKVKPVMRGESYYE